MMRLQKYGDCKVVLFFLVLAGCMLTLCVLYYNKEKEETLSDVQAFVMKSFQKEMDARVDSVSKDIQVWGKGSLLGNESGITVFYGENRKEKFEINAESDSLNISHISFERIAHSFSLLDYPFQVDSFRRICEKGLVCISSGAKGGNGAKGTYKYKGKWENIDHIIVSPALAADMSSCKVNDAPFMLEEDSKYGGVQPLRTYRAWKYRNGYSDHLPLVARFVFH